MQSVSSKIWTRVAVSISYDDKPLHHGHLPKGSTSPSYNPSLILFWFNFYILCWTSEEPVILMKSF